VLLDMEIIRLLTDSDGISFPPLGNNGRYDAECSECWTRYGWKEISRTGQADTRVAMQNTYIALVIFVLMGKLLL
jgi:hypothetical protein